jgi:hypothetical protein
MSPDMNPNATQPRANGSSQPDAMIVVPTRNMVLYPEMVLPLTIGRPSSVAAVQQAVREQRQIVLLLQRDPENSEPKPDDLYRVGTVANILRYVTSPEGGHHLVVQGVQRFDNVPTILEAIARAGGLADGPVNLTHCAVMRGRDRIAWIDLQALMDGRDLALNLRLKPDDLLLVPEDGDLPVYVIGEVVKPGPYRYTRNMSILDALAQAGGLTRDSYPYGITVVRPSQNRQIVVSRSDMLEPQVSTIIALERGDIVFVPSNALAKIGYFLEKIDIFNWVFVPGAIRSR